MSGHLQYLLVMFLTVWVVQTGMYVCYRWPWKQQLVTVILTCGSMSLLMHSLRVFESSLPTGWRPREKLGQTTSLNSTWERKLSVHTYLKLCIPTWTWLLMFLHSYNNQWMIVDYKRFNIGKNITNGTLWIVEQVPWDTYTYHLPY